MFNGIMASALLLRELNKGRGSKFCVGSRVRQETPEGDRKTYRPKRYEYKDEDNCLKTLKDEDTLIL